MKSSVTLNFLKNYFKDIKQIFKETSNEFEQVKFICLRKFFKIKLAIHNVTKIFRQILQQMTATGLEPRTTKFLNEHSTI